MDAKGERAGERPTHSFFTAKSAESAENISSWLRVGELSAFARSYGAIAPKRSEGGRVRIPALNSQPSTHNYPLSAFFAFSAVKPHLVFWGFCAFSRLCVPVMRFPHR